MLFNVAILMTVLAIECVLDTDWEVVIAKVGKGGINEHGSYMNDLPTSPTTEKH